MSVASTVPLSSMNLRAVLRSTSISLTAVASSWSELFSDVVKVARSLLSATNCLSLWCSALTNVARLLVTAKKSPRPSFNAATASPNARNVELICLPLPLSPSASDSTKSPSGPFGWLGVGPSSVTSLSSWLRMSSHSTGDWVRSRGITALSVSAGPPV